MKLSKINKEKRELSMFIVDHKFTKPNGDITPYQSEIINLVQHKQSDLMKNDGFLGVNLDTTPDNTCFTISIYWESKEIRDASNITTQAVQPNLALQQYCFDNEIIQTKVKREIS